MISDSTAECISLDNCSRSIIHCNTLSKNGFYALDMKGRSTNNTVSNNTISDNHHSGGIYIYDSSGNAFFNNNSINNKNSAGYLNHVESVKSTNTWNSSYPRGGNFWDDYASKTIVDEWSGKNLTSDKIYGPDGIGDTSYPIKENNTDHYPLMNPYGHLLRLMCDMECTIYRKTGEAKETVCVEFHPVAIFSDSIITSFNFSTQKEVNFTVVNGTFCKLIVSKKLLDGALAIFVDDDPTVSFLSCDETHIFANFTYSSGSHKVRIEGEFGTRILDTDINHDGKVDIIDITMVAKDRGKEEEVNPVAFP